MSCRINVAHSTPSPNAHDNPGDDASDAVSTVSTTRYLSAYPELHRLVNRLLEDAQRFVDDMIAEIRNRRHQNHDQQSSQSKSNSKRRTRLQPSTKAILQKWFEDHISYPYPTPAEKQKLIEECGGDVTPAMVANWFFNTRKRVRWRPDDFQGGSKLAGRRRPKPNSSHESEISPQDRNERNSDDSVRQ